MNSDAANALAEALSKFGDGMARDARLCRSILSDLVPHRKREIRILSTAVEEGAPAELLARATNTPETVLVESLSKRLHNHHGLDLELSRWAVQSWANAIKRANLSAGPSSGSAPGTPAKKAPATQSQPQVVRVLMVLGLLLVLIVGTGVWMAVKLLSTPEKPVAVVDPRPPVVEPGPQPGPRETPQPKLETKAPTPPVNDAPKTTVVPEPKASTPDTSKPKATNPLRGPEPVLEKPVSKPPVIEPKKPEPPPVVDPRIALREQLRRRAGEVDSLLQPLDTRVASLRKQLADTQTDIKERKKLLSYLERAYQRATDEQRWPMRASGFTYSQPNAKRAMEAIGVHIEQQTQSVAALEPLIQSLAALSMEGGMLKGDIDCLSGVRSDPGCGRVELTKSSVDTLLRRADDYRKRVDATPKANPPINTLDLSKIPQP